MELGSPLVVRDATRRRLSYLLLLASWSCAGRAPVVEPPVAPARNIEQTLFLIGDGGEPDQSGEPVLQALTAALEANEAPSMVVFLGDNIYPAGLPPPRSSERAEMERRLKDQIDAVARTDAAAIFIPGNHDWDDSGSNGWDAVRRQEDFIAEHGGEGRVVLLPHGGCPGPEVVDHGARLRIVALDTAWWLHEHEKGGPADCTPGTEETSTRALVDAVASRGDRQVIVVAHHPLLSSGPHGGYFNWQDHLFPLTRAWKPLWVPLPVIGSGYPLARKAGISSSDLSSSEYEHLVSTLEAALANDPPLIFAAGHEHTLEVLRGGTRARYLVVSGAGFYGHTSPTKWRDTSLYKNGAAGFVRIDVERGGRLRLGVVIVDRDGSMTEPFAIHLD